MRWCGSVNSMQFKSLLIFLLFLTTEEVVGIAWTHEKPNVLLITADDLGWDSLGCMGNNLKGLTPNLDHLATEGLLFTHGFVANRSVVLPAKPFTPEDSPKAPVCSDMVPNLPSGGTRPGIIPVLNRLPLNY